MIKLMELIAGRHDVKETLVLVKKIFKSYGVNPKIDFKTAVPKHGSRKNYAHYDFDRNVIWINPNMNKDTKNFLMSVIHETWHAVQAKKNGGGRKFADKYELEMNKLVQQGKDEYWDNKYEIEAENVAKRDYSKWVKEVDHLNKKNDKVR
tara:strand:+ start:797 stop:1246 length:450 start_codon:yes stop_codon:yes gene_type:complete